MNFCEGNRGMCLCWEVCVRIGVMSWWTVFSLQFKFHEVNDQLSLWNEVRMDSCVRVVMYCECFVFSIIQISCDEWPTISMKWSWMNVMLWYPLPTHITLSFKFCVMNHQLSLFGTISNNDVYIISLHPSSPISLLFKFHEVHIHMFRARINFSYEDIIHSSSSIILHS